MDVKALTAQYASLLVPFAALNIVAIVFGLSGSATLTLGLAGISLFFSMCLVPALAIYTYVLKYKPQVNSMYWSFGAMLSTLIISYFIGYKLVEGMIDKIDTLLSVF
ncbi:hypothetical protein MUN89_06455 [Halobacillus salinarum]|uniref:Uncharacterized protein n=1 Tax=Halobacillus salinarum TaxID=2932257 RepID=A0ABY4EMA2_9BACI|nr:hypothetical protein [Halobacillus salinarum]UOQ45579.1 hypothetical protein MUN89_06455 [Halobacillus salinarum]